MSTSPGAGLGWGREPDLWVPLARGIVKSPMTAILCQIDSRDADDWWDVAACQGREWTAGFYFVDILMLKLMLYCIRCRIVSAGVPLGRIGE